MKRQSILFVRSMWVVILFTTLAACKDTDNRVFGDDFEFPALTDENTIRFTVNVVGDWRQLDIVASGGRMVIDWGNGRIQKIEDPSSMSGGVVYRYGNKGLYEAYRYKWFASSFESSLFGKYAANEITGFE